MNQAPPITFFGKNSIVYVDQNKSKIYFQQGASPGVNKYRGHLIRILLDWMLWAVQKWQEFFLNLWVFFLLWMKDFLKSFSSFELLSCYIVYFILDPYLCLFSIIQKIWPPIGFELSTLWSKGKCYTTEIAMLGWKERF